MRYLCAWSLMYTSIQTIVWIVSSITLGVAQSKDIHTSVKDSEGPTFQLQSPMNYRDEPWVICLLTEGPHLVYKAQAYTAQPRYGTWTVDWRRYRPHGYTHDEDVGLVTTVALQNTLDKILDTARRQELKPELIQSSPPCSQEAIERRPLPSTTHDAPSLTTWLWILASVDRIATSEGEHNQYRWHQWRFDDPHLTIKATQRKLIQMVKKLVHSSAPPQEDVDRLLKPAERGSLTLKVSKASSVWINGVYYGASPSLRLIYLPDGYYSIHVVPFDKNYEPISYEDVEVLAGRQTTFKILVE